MHSIFHLDELLCCPQAGAGLKAQRRFQQRMFNGFIAQVGTIPPPPLPTWYTPLLLRVINNPPTRPINHVCVFNGFISQVG